MAWSVLSVEKIILELAGFIFKPAAYWVVSNLEHMRVHETIPFKKCAENICEYNLLLK